MANINWLAEIVDDAAVLAEPIPQLSMDNPLTVKEAYSVQAASVRRRVARGERRMGVKMGFTSKAKMAQMGVDDLIWGRLTDGMIVEDGGEIDLRTLIHPRVEPEIAFLLKRPLPAKVTMAEAMASVEAVAPAMEIIDSRYRDFRFSLADVVADNTSAAGFVIGAWHPPDVDVSNLGMILEVNGRPRQIGSSAAILGHPVRALVSAARLSAAAGEPLQDGWIVLAGGATAAESLAEGDHVRTEAESLGPVSFSVGGSADAGAAG
jgi:2-oxo-3-hexenedioate decarboxylase